MSLASQIQEKLDKGTSLSDEEVAWAADHSMELPEEYGDAVRSHTAEREAGRPYDPLLETGPAFAQPGPSGPGLFLTEDQLNSLTKDMLFSLAEATEQEVSGTKAEMVAQLAGTASSEPEDEYEDEEG